jgi:LCP family protein required for cell wall assembly
LPIAAAVLSAVLPGAGQWYAGRRLRSLFFLIPILFVLAGVAIGVATGSLGPRSLLGWVVQPTLLRMSLVANAAVLVWRAAAVIDAYVVAGGRRPSLGFALSLAATLVAVVVAPQVAAASYTVRSITLLESVFVAEEEPTEQVLSVEMIREPEPPEKRPAPDEPVVFESNRSTRNLVFRQGIGDPEAVEAWVDIVAPPVPEAPLPPYEERVAGGRLTMLLVGADEGPGRDGLRTDTMIVATFDVESGEAALFGLPRNFKRVPLPSEFRTAFVELEKEAINKEAVDDDGDGFPDTWTDRNGDGIPDRPRFRSCRCFPEMLNRVHENTKDWTTTYPDTPDPGLAALRDVVAHLIDLRIDYYVMVNMEGFVEVVDAIGGVDVMVAEPYHVAVSAPSEGSPKARVNVEPGMNHLSGLEALAYSRWRIGSSDYDRMQRQRCLIRAAADQLDPLTLARSFHRLADVIERSVVTDIPVSFLPDLVNILGGVNLEQVTTVGLVPPTYNSGRTSGGYPVPNVNRIRAKVAEVLEAGSGGSASGVASECGM